MQNSQKHLLYEYQLGNKLCKAVQNICQAICQRVVSKSTPYDWFCRFKSKDYTLKDKPKSGRPCFIDLDLLKTLIDSDLRLTSRCFADNLKCSHTNEEYYLD